jgi:hypothetical protein
MDPMNRATYRRLPTAVTILMTALAAVACGSSGGSSSSEEGGSGSSGGGASSGASSGGTGSGGTGSSGAAGAGAGSDASAGGATNNALSDGAPNLFGIWLTANAAKTTFSELTLNSNGTYELDVLVTTSSVTGDEYTQQGNFTVNGAQITLAPTEASCPGPLNPSTYSYAVDAAVLVLIDASSDSSAWAATTSRLGAGLSLVVGCSVSGAPWSPEPTVGSPPVASDPGTNPTPYGRWLDVASASASSLLTLNSDGTYEYDLLFTTSTQTGDEYVQKGTFVLNGADLVLTPTEASCPGRVPVGTNSYGINGVALSTTDASGTQANYAATTTTALGNGLTLVVGCSQNNGPWMPEPVAPVAN